MEVRGKRVMEGRGGRAGPRHQVVDVLEFLKDLRVK